MFFLVRCLVCIGLVYALAQSDRDPTPSLPLIGVTASRQISAPPPATPRPRLNETAKALAQAGVEALGAAAREHCLSAPQDCVEILRKLNGVRER